MKNFNIFLFLFLASSDGWGSAGTGARDIKDIIVRCQGVRQTTSYNTYDRLEEKKEEKIDYIFKIQVIQEEQFITELDGVEYRHNARWLLWSDEKGEWDRYQVRGWPALSVAPYEVHGFYEYESPDNNRSNFWGGKIDRRTGGFLEDYFGKVIESDSTFSMRSTITAQCSPASEPDVSDTRF